ncbi:DNRLRE domain-containing protein [Nonomuraea glycinis]|uniref:LamG-like jellyroll fold domain-containing protein n=1 Tax=Nonomuraea glycinis TaxID=2047744 RepID=UPI001665B9CD|nr:LamG-like jellyroll fold domain-containing protein [Nonomuraea glycinis]MCA2176373.1 DNRLRE domain-containing protein [Nonomuraea glycinis]
MRVARGLFVVTLVAALAAAPLTQPDAVAQARQNYEPTEARQTDETAGLRQSDRAAEAAGDRGVGGEPEESALALARRTKQPVEVTALRSETRQVFAEPDGTLVLEQHPRPVRVRKQGRWQDVDTTLTTRPDGSVAPVATAVDLSFSGGGTSPLARMARGAKALELGWQGALPTPVLDGDTATYPEVLPGVDLQVKADVDGFSHLLVVKTREAAANKALTELDYPLSTSGLSMKSTEGGNLEAVDGAGGTIFTASPPLMWDSSGAPATRTLAAEKVAPPDARSEIMGVELTGKRLKLRPHRAMLTDPRTRFPVYLDPYFSASRGAWTAVWNIHPTSSFFNASDVARVGKVDSQKNRSFFQMNTGSTIHGKQIVNATLRTYETWSYSCTKRNVEAWATNTISKATTWNKQPTWVTKLDTVNAAKGWSASCMPGGVEFDVTAQVKDAAAKNWPNITIGLRASSETDNYGWKKFRNNPKLVIEYNSLPSAPVAADTWSDPGGDCVSGAGRPIVSKATPTLWAKLRDADNSVKGRFEWWDAAGVKVGERLTGVGSTGSAFNALVPAGAFADGSLIRWRVRAEDGLANSAWSPWCEATVDASAPGTEPGVTSPDYVEGGWSGGVGRAGSFTFTPNGVTDVAGYLYGLDTAPKNEVAAGSTDGSATIRLTPRHDGPNVLSVRAKDRAGHQGPIRSYLFNVNGATAPDAHWPLDDGDGTVATDRAGTRHAALQGTATWATGRTGLGLRLAGGGHAQTSGPAVSTLSNFTVAAWVRLNSATATATAVGQDGGRAAGFALQYSKADDRWALARSGTDTDGAPAVRALSAAAPRLGEWTHLTGVYDAAARELTLYVNGRLESSVPFTQPWEAAGPLSIGRGKASGAAAEFWPGDVDDVRAYGRAMFGDEVADLVNSAATLVGHWTLDEETGVSAADSSGRATAATVGGGATWTEGWLDGGLGLDGVDGHAQTSAPAVDTRAGFTVSAWTQLDYLPTRDAAIVSQVGSRAGGFQLGYDNEKGRWTLAMAAADTDSAALVRTRSDAVPTPLEWTHVAGVYDPLVGELRVYVNGRLSESTITGHVSAWKALGPLQLGRTKTAGVFTGYWPGTVDDVRTYDGVLSTERIAQLAAQ